MATFQDALVCAALALAMWGCIGLAVGRWLLPRELVLPSAPLLGWAAHSVLAFPLFCLIGMSKPTVVACAAAAIGASVLFLVRYGRRSGVGGEVVGVPVPAMIGAFLLGCAVMMAIVPTVAGDGAGLAPAIFDHSKIAMIDDMARLGVPAGNPFIGGSGDGLSRLSYYYLWHFAAAEIAVLGGFSGWEADAGMTCFTAVSSLMLMMGLAVWLSSRTSSAFWVLAVAATASIRDLLSFVFGWRLVGTISGWSTGFGGWLNQVTWAPQHVASAGCAVLAIVLLIRMAERPDWRFALGLSLVSAASFESSTWVGGITYPLVAVATGAFLLGRIAPDRRRRFVASAVVAGLLAIALSSLFIHDQLRASVLRAGGSPISVSPFEVLDEPIPEALRRLLDVPAYWTTFLFVEFAAFYPLGFVFAVRLSKDKTLPDHRIVLISLGVLAVISLAVGGLLVSNVAANNDLAWRGVLPGILVLVALTAAGLGRYLFAMPRPYLIAALAVVALASVSGVRDLYRSFEIKPQASAGQFSDSLRMWAAVRKNSARGERVVNNPTFLADMTQWPINISWALLAHRRSCYAGPDLALPFAPMTREERAKTEEAFTRLFAGKADREEVDRLAAAFDCSLVVVTPNDGAWTTGPLAENSMFPLVDSKADTWRIYRLRTSPSD